MKRPTVVCKQLTAVIRDAIPKLFADSRGPTQEEQAGIIMALAIQFMAAVSATMKVKLDCENDIPDVILAAREILRKEEFDFAIEQAFDVERFKQLPDS